MRAEMWIGVISDAHECSMSYLLRVPVGVVTRELGFSLSTRFVVSEALSCFKYPYREVALKWRCSATNIEVGHDKQQSVL